MPHLQGSDNTGLPATQALQAELEARPATLAAARADTLAAGEAAAEAERLQAQLERLGAERDDLAAALEGVQQVCERTNVVKWQYDAAETRNARKAMRSSVCTRGG